MVTHLHIQAQHLMEEHLFVEIVQQVFAHRRCSSCTRLDNWRKLDEVFQEEMAERSRTHRT